MKLIRVSVVEFINLDTVQSVKLLRLADAVITRVVFARGHTDYRGADGDLIWEEVNRAYDAESARD